MKKKLAINFIKFIKKNDIKKKQYKNLFFIIILLCFKLIILIFPKLII